MSPPVPTEIPLISPPIWADFNSLDRKSRVRLGKPGTEQDLVRYGLSLIEADSFDNAMAESVMGLFKTELHRNPAALEANGGPWKGLDDLEPATCGWVSWFNEDRLHSELDDKTPAEFEAEYRHRSQPDAA